MLLSRPHTDYSSTQHYHIKLNFLSFVFLPELKEDKSSKPSSLTLGMTDNSKFEVQAKVVKFHNFF